MAFGASVVSFHQDTVISSQKSNEDVDSSTESDQTHLLASNNMRQKILEHPDYSRERDRNLTGALRKRSWISYNEFESSSDEDFGAEKAHLSGSSTSTSLPAGVVRGCSHCSSCQKVLARWRPEAGCRPALEEAPAFFPLEEEFKDTMKYIASISAEAEKYGICRIVPPQTWRPPCPLRDSEKRQTMKFPTRVQEINRLQVREPQRKRRLRTKRKRRGRTSQRCLMGRRSVTLTEDEKCIPTLLDENNEFGFNPGPDFTIESFEQYANQFKEEYFKIKQNLGLSTDMMEPTVEMIEGEYWRIVEHATEQIEVLYGADIDTAEFGSGFPKAKLGEEPTSYETSGWNLNNVARQPGSILDFEEEDISGVLVPWLYVGMCFSSFCWHVEDHYFYSLNYMHWGSPKVWYGVPSIAAMKLEEAMRKHLPDLFEEQPNLLHKLVTQLSPSILRAEGVPVFRAVQKAGEFVVTFPRAYHAGFNCGFNCAEAVNVAPVDWLPHGQCAVELYRVQRRKSSVSHDKLLIGTTKQALRLLQKLKGGEMGGPLMTGWQELCSEKGILLKALKERVDMEHSRRTAISSLVHVRKMDKSFDAANEKECFVCHYDLHLSAVGCGCCAERYTCLDHVEFLCACGPVKKFALYRYDMNELNNIVVALEKQLLNVNGWLSEKSFHLSGSSNDIRNVIHPFNLCIHMPNNEPTYGVKLDTNEKLFPLSGSSNDIQNAMHSFNLCTQIPNKGSTYGVKLDTNDMELAYTPCLLNQQSYEFRLQSEPGSGLLKRNAKSLVQVDSEENTVFILGSGKCEVSRPHEEGISCGQNIDNLIMGKVANGQESHRSIRGDSASFERHKMLTDDKFDFKKNVYTRHFNSKPLYDKDSLRKRNSEVILLSDDDDDNANRIDKPGWCNVDIAARNKTDIEMPVSRRGKQVHSYSQEVNNTQEWYFKTSKMKCRQGGCSYNCPADWVDKAIENSERQNNLSSELDIRSIHQAVECSSVIGNQLEAQWTKTESVLNYMPCDGNAEEHFNPAGYLDQSLDHNSKDTLVNPYNACVSNSLFPKVGYEVELIHAGTLVLQTGWYNKDAIFPAGFMSRVQFPSIQDPLQTCFYISEIINNREGRPLFKVIMEHPTSSELVAAHSCIHSCWQMVQEKINDAIRNCHVRVTNLSSLQYLQNTDGIKMFGLSTPYIVEVIESLDWQHQCEEYWAGRLNKVNGRESTVERSCISIDACGLRCDTQVVGLNMPKVELDLQADSNLLDCSEEMYTILKALFKKATSGELLMLHKLFNSEWGGLNWKEGINALLDELADR